MVRLKEYHKIGCFEMGNTQDFGEKPVRYVEPALSTEKIQSTTGMAALIEEHADMWGGAERLAKVLDCCTDAKTWNALGNMLSLDMLDGIS